MAWCKQALKENEVNVPSLLNVLERGRDSGGKQERTYPHKGKSALKSEPKAASQGNRFHAI